MTGGSFFTRWCLTALKPCLRPSWPPCWAPSVSVSWARRRPQRRISCGSLWVMPGTSPGTTKSVIWCDRRTFFYPCWSCCPELMIRWFDFCLQHSMARRWRGHPNLHPGVLRWLAAPWSYSDPTAELPCKQTAESTSCTESKSFTDSTSTESKTCTKPKTSRTQHKSTGEDYF